MSEDAKSKSQIKTLCPLEKVLRVVTLLVGLRLPAEEIRENLGGQSIGGPRTRASMTTRARKKKKKHHLEYDTRCPIKT